MKVGVYIEIVKSEFDDMFNRYGVPDEYQISDDNFWLLKQNKELGMFLQPTTRKDTFTFLGSKLKKVPSDDEYNTIYLLYTLDK